MITTEQEYLLKLYCLECSFGSMVTKYINGLRLGTACSELKEKLVYIYYGMTLIKSYDTRDIALGEKTYSYYTLEEMQQLMQLLNTKMK